MSVVLFTGAGASAPFGYPTTNQFFSNDVLDDVIRVGAKQTLNEVWKILEAQKRGSQYDVEEVFLLIEPFLDLLDTRTGALLRRMQADKWCENLTKLSKVLREQCFSNYGKQADEKAVEEVYTRWLDSFEWRDAKVSLFTTNYDRIPRYLWEIARQNKLGFYDGFNELGKWDPQGYGRGPNGLDVYHLHGSLAWYAEGGTIYRNFSYERLAAGIERHVLIYPGFKGDPEADPSFPKPVTDSHRHLRKLLRKAANLVVVGFSFRDETLNRTFGNALSENRALKLHIVNRSVPDGARKLVEIAGDRFNHAEGHFEEEAAVEKVAANLS